MLKGMPADAWTARRKWANSRCPGATLFLGWHIHMQTQMHKQLGRHHKAVMQCLMDHTGGGGLSCLNDPSMQTAAIQAHSPYVCQPTVTKSVTLSSHFTPITQTLYW